MSYGREGPDGGRPATARDGGSIALEAVLVLPVAALVVVALLGAVVPVVDAVALDAAARAAARAVALDGDLGRAGPTVAARVAGAVVETRVDGGLVVVRVHRVRDVLGVPVVVDGRAVAPLEPGAPP